MSQWNGKRTSEEEGIIVTRSELGDNERMGFLVRHEYLVMII
jgi:hypothetical protein